MTSTQASIADRLAPWCTLDPIARPFGRLLNASSVSGPEEDSWIPAVNVAETTDELILSADLPGLTEEDIEIGLEKRVLTIRGKLAETRNGNDEGRRFHLCERRFGSFERSFTLPSTVSADAITATLENGVLCVQMPKAPKSKARAIQIKKGS